MNLLDLSHPQWADLPSCAVANRNHPIRVKIGEAFPGLALQTGRLITALSEISQGQGMHSINRRAAGAGRLKETGAALGCNGLTQDAAAAVMRANKE